jgi:thiol-disulfide isomerase/thioredoxin
MKTIGRREKIRVRVRQGVVPRTCQLREPMGREEFLTMLGFALGGATSRLSSGSLFPSTSPSPTASPDKWDECEKSAALPYNRPLGLTMRVLDGPDFDLKKCRGKAVLLHVFATWCGPCNGEMPYLVEAAKDYSERDLVVVGIDSHEEDNTVRSFRKRYGIAFPIAMDSDGSFVRALEVGQSNTSINYPVTLFIDPNGYLYCDLVGSVGRSQLRYRIERFLTASAAAISARPSPAPTPHH